MENLDIHLKGSIDVASNFDDIAKLWGEAPEEVFRQTHKAVAKMFQRHRKETIAGIKKAPKLKAMAKRSLFFKMEPSEKEAQQRTHKDLGKISGSLDVKGKVPLAHEFGVSINSKDKRLAIPIMKGAAGMSTKALKSKGWDSPESFRKRYPGRKLYTKQGSRRKRKSTILFVESDTLRLKNGRPKGEKMFLLTSKVTIPARYGIRSTWASLASHRDEKIKEAEEAVVKHLMRVRFRRGRRRSVG